MKTLKYIFFIPLFAIVLSSCDLNEYAPEMEDQTFDLNEYSPAGVVVGKMIANDGDDDQVLTYEIVWASEEGIFDIDPLDGTIYIADSEKLVYEQTQEVKLTISVTDSHKRFPIESTAEAIIHIIDTNFFLISLQPDGEKGKDAIIGSIVLHTNYGESELVDLYAWTQGGNLNIVRTVIDFDLSDIPEGAIIDSAFISFYFNNTTAYGDKHQGDTDFIIQRITSDWEESTVTWFTQPSATTVNQVLVAGASTPMQDFPHINITQLIRDYCQDMDNSYGLLMKLKDESPYNWLLLSSSDHPNEQLRPKLDLYYSVIVE